jgi:hypothetical protein
VESVTLDRSLMRGQLQKMAGASFTTLTDTQNAFLHLARLGNGSLS